MPHPACTIGAVNTKRLDIRKLPFAAITGALLLGGCAGSVSGTFEPACIAHEGDRIVLSDGRFEWHRFTDVVNVDEAGNRMDPFPAYPKAGTYRRDGDKLILEASDGSALGERYLLDYRGRTYLLTYEQNEAVLDGEPMPACALVLAGDGG